jgi:hypothetical protein
MNWMTLWMTLRKEVERTDGNGFCSLFIRCISVIINYPFLFFLSTFNHWDKVQISLDWLARRLYFQLDLPKRCLLPTSLWSAQMSHDLGSLQLPTVSPCCVHDRRGPCDLYWLKGARGKWVGRVLFCPLVSYLWLYLYGHHKIKKSQFLYNSDQLSLGQKR